MKKRKKKARSCIVKPREERGGLNKREGENWQRKSLTMSPSGIKLSRNLFIYNLVNLVAPLLQGWSHIELPPEFHLTRVTYSEMTHPLKERCKCAACSDNICTQRIYSVVLILISYLVLFLSFFFQWRTPMILMPSCCGGWSLYHGVSHMDSPVCTLAFVSVLWATAWKIYSPASV